MQDSRLGERVAQRYAEALLALGQEQNLTARFGTDLELVAQVLVKEPKFQDFLGSPVLELNTKKELLSQAFAQDIHPFTLNFLSILIDRRRSMFTLPVCRAFQRILRTLEKTTLAEVTSAVALTPEQIEQLKVKLTALVQSDRIELLCVIDPDLLGGMVVKFGDQVIDVSLRGQLRRLALQLK